MASVLRHIVASNRAQHEETGLDLCYVTSNLLATCVLFFLGFTLFICAFITLFSLYPSFRVFLLGRLPHPVVMLVRRAASRPRVRHRETGLDLGYLTGDIIVTCVVVSVDADSFVSSFFPLFFLWWCISAGVSSSVFVLKISRYPEWSYISLCRS